MSVEQKKSHRERTVGLRTVEGELPADANIVYPVIHTRLQWGKEARRLLMERSSLLPGTFNGNAS